MIKIPTYDLKRNSRETICIYICIQVLYLVDKPQIAGVWLDQKKLLGKNDIDLGALAMKRITCC